MEIPAPDDNGRVAVFNRVDFQRWQELLELCRTRLRADYLGLRTQALRNQDRTIAPSLASHLSERRAPRRLTTGVVPRGFIDETYDFKNALAEIAGPDDPSQLSRFLHDGMFRAAYEEFVEGLGLDPAIAPELVDIGVARDDNGAYTITFRAWLPSALRLRSGEREFAGSQCNLALTIQVRAGGEINTEQPRFDFDLLIEVPEIAPRVTRTDEPQIDVEEVRNDPFEIRVRPQELAFPRNAPVGQNPDTGTHDGPIAPEQPPVEQVPEIDAPREIPEIELENLQIEVPGIARPSRCRTSKRPPETRSTPLWSWT